MDYPVPFFQIKENRIQCLVCPHQCKIPEGKFGLCKVRAVKNKRLVATNYGEVTSISLDPIEKKPLYHFKPESYILSLGTFGCNMTCSFCQNYEISQKRPNTQHLSVEELCRLLPTIENNIGIAFTYNEPLMWYEYIYDAIKSIKKYHPHLDVVLVTNGYINEEPLMKLLPYVDAMNIDLKGYSNHYYKKICGATLEPVLETIKRANEYCHVEVTTLLVTDELDILDEVEKISKFLASVNPNIPLHLSRYFPRYKMQNEATSLDMISKALDVAKKYLNYVYIGNVPGSDINTYCLNCGTLLIQRHHYHTKCLIKEPICPNCQIPLPLKL
ncbi:MAG: AmmeMemoRadiSam system radical SAM enzyme [Turicibacter sp.]|nr:AmmeMemoRadiSam system radical SAM enzyme [Turicibacter sp.]